MPIPNFEAIMLPFLKSVRDKNEHALQDTASTLAAQFKLTDEEKAELLPSGQQAIFNNRVGWSRTFLKKAGLIESTRRGYFKITDRGLDVLKANLPEINSKYLQQFEEFKAFVHGGNKPAKSKVDEAHTQTPQEELESAYQELRNSLVDELITRIKESPPELFEGLVVNLLVAMGYGGNRIDAGRAVGKAGDEGIDGTIKEDRLGLDIIYIQAKRWDGTVGRP